MPSLFLRFFFKRSNNLNEPELCVSHDTKAFISRDDFCDIANFLKKQMTISVRLGSE